MPRFLCSVLAVCALTFLVGCGSGSVAVEGKVTVNDAPLDTGNVSFHPAAAAGSEGGVIGYGEIGADGSYKLMAEGKPGLPAGKYKVVVSAGKPSNPADPYSVPIPLVDPKFSNLSSTPLEVEVSSGAAAGKYDLKLTK